MGYRQFNSNPSPALAKARLTLLAAALGVAGMANAPAQTPVSTSAPRNLSIQPAKTAASRNSEQRIALVIGNSAYKEAALANPVNDARAIARALADTGFQVTVKENSDQKTMLAAVREFGDKLRNGGTGLFYYAGHGMQIKGRNYLIPVGANIEREDEVAYAAVDAQAVLDKMESAGNNANIMILDACRNNPFTRSSRSGQAGLAQMDAPVGTLVAYATSPGAVASDGAGSNGLYTQHLLQALREPGTKVEDVFKRVRAGVRKDSQGKQVPWESTSLEGDFYFTPPPAPLPVVSPSDALESALWDAVKTSNVSTEVQAYLNRYPNGRFAAQAQALLARLQRSIPATPAAPAKVPPPVAAATTATASHAGLRFAVGDRWDYGKANIKDNTVSAFNYTVSQVDAGGTVHIQSGKSERTLDPYGRMLTRKDEERERRYSDDCKVRPTRMQPGEHEPIECAVESIYAKAPSSRWVGKGYITFAGREKIQTPAGEFLADKVIRILSSNSQEGRGEEITYWYVEGMKYWAAQEYQFWASDSKARTHDISVLMHYSLKDAKALTAIQNNMLEAAAYNNGAPGHQFSNFVRSLAASSEAVTAPPPTTKFTLGDTWRFQVTDRFTQKSKMYGRRITAMEPDGTIAVDGGAVRWTAQGAELVRDYHDGYRLEYTSGHVRYPTELRAGASEEIRYTLQWKEPTRAGVEKYQVTMKTVGQEKVKVPAGEFLAWRVEINGSIEATGPNGTGPGSVRQTCWYAPEVLTYVACDYERRFGNKLANYERTELTEYSVAHAYRMAQKH